MVVVLISGRLLILGAGVSSWHRHIRVAMFYRHTPPCTLLHTEYTYRDVSYILHVGRAR